MNKTPNSMRFTIGIFGCTNVGKSTLLNKLVKEDISITSPIKGTTTDSVKKAYEIDDVGAVLFIDTAGIDDNSNLGKQRVKKAFLEINSIDLAIIVLKNRALNKYEIALIDKFKKECIQMLFVVNKFDDGITNLELKNAIVLNLLKDKTDEIFTQIKK